MKIQKKNAKSVRYTLLVMGLMLSMNAARSDAKNPTAGGGPVNTVDLRSAANYVLLARSGITTTGTTSVVGNMGVSPIAGTAITGFGLVMDATNKYATSSLVTGKVYAADYADPTPSTLITAMSDMELAYNDAAGRLNPKENELGAGNISGLTLSAGLYKWSSVVMINGGVTLKGGSSDVFIFQIAQGLTVGSNTIVTLSGVQAKNVFWQVAGVASLGSSSSFQGNILSKTSVVFENGAKLNGRALCQTNITMIGNAVTQAK